MEANDKFKYCMSLGNEFKSSKNNVFEFQSPFTKESLTKASMDSLNGQIPSENNETMHTLKPTEVFKTDRSLEISTKLLRRSSLMKLFDPLHSIQQTMKLSDDYCNSFTMGERIEFSTEIYNAVFPKEIVNKTATSSYMDDTLISLTSPMKVGAKPMVRKTENINPVRKYSQKEFLQKVKVQELSLQKEYFQKLSEYEMACTEKDQKLVSELSKLSAVNRSYSVVIQEILTKVESMKSSNERNEKKLEDLHASNETLKLDIKATKEDSSNMENAFSDNYKRYETSKSMIKSYKENEQHLTKNIENVQLAIDEQESINVLLNSRIQDLTNKAAKEIDSARKSTNTQIMILEAQLKKYESKIGSLENDLKPARSINDKFVNTYEDLINNLTV